MKWNIIITILFISVLMACESTREDRVIFFLHNRFLETHEVTEVHPEFGRTEYQEIINKFDRGGFKVISELRKGDTNARVYALRVVSQIDSLINMGIEPNRITVVGTSKGGYIAQYVSTFADNQDLNFVFVASFQNSDIQNIPEINFCGNILNIYENTDPYGVSVIERIETSTCDIKHFREIKLNTGLGHGFLFRPLAEWTHPAIEWARGNYKVINRYEGDSK